MFYWGFRTFFCTGLIFRVPVQKAYAKMGNQKRGAANKRHHTPNSTFTDHHTREGHSHARDIHKRRDAKPQQAPRGLNRTLPADYEFLRFGKGNGLMEEAMKLSQAAGIPTFLVKEEPRGVANSVQLQLARVGRQVRRDMVAQAAENLELVKYRDEYVASSEAKMDKALKRAILNGTIDGEVYEKKKQLYQAKTSIKEMFPNIDDESCDKIAEHAWASNPDGTPRIGLVEEEPLERRVQLAVSAHIRHVYTDYDFLLKAFSWEIAREMQAPEFLAKIKEWMGADFDDSTATALQELQRAEDVHGAASFDWGQGQQSSCGNKRRAVPNGAATRSGYQRRSDASPPSSSNRNNGVAKGDYHQPAYDGPVAAHQDGSSRTQHPLSRQIAGQAPYGQEPLVFRDQVYQSIEPSQYGAPKRYLREEPRPLQAAEARPAYMPLTSVEGPSQYSRGAPSHESSRAAVYEAYGREQNPGRAQVGPLVVEKPQAREALGFLPQAHYVPTHQERPWQDPGREQDFATGWPREAFEASFAIERFQTRGGFEQLPQANYAPAHHEGPQTQGALLPSHPQYPHDIHFPQRHGLPPHRAEQTEPAHIRGPIHAHTPLPPRTRVYLQRREGNGGETPQMLGPPVPYQDHQLGQQYRFVDGAPAPVQRYSRG